MPVSKHSLLQLRSCESLLQAKENFDRIVQKDREDRRRLEQKLSETPITNKPKEG